jgi:hypothetical protein
LTILTASGAPLTTELFNFRPNKAAPKESFSLYQGNGWYIVNDTWIDLRIIEKRDLKVKTEELEKAYTKIQQLSTGIDLTSVSKRLIITGVVLTLAVGIVAGIYIGKKTSSNNKIQTLPLARF